MGSVKNYILKEFEAKKLTQEETKKMLLELKDNPAEENVHEDIAIIGMACKFPGAKNVDEYWSNLKSGVNSIKEPSKQRRDESAVYYRNKVFTKCMLDITIPDDVDIDEQFAKGGYLEEIDKFDAGFFRIPPREAKFMEPLQRLFLETAWEAIEDGGYGGNKIIGTRTGVFAGRDHTTSSLYQHISEPDQMHLTGSWAGIMASRIQYIFNLRGPSLVVDTACSAGLTATHMACRSLVQGECDMALSGGIHLTYLPSLKGQKSSMDMVESSDGKVRTFDKGANGTVWGEGVGILFLKKLSKALEDGDNIHAVIKGSAINNDGASNGITAPNADAQEDVIIDAWTQAQINPESISYIEAHGTGTILGDPIEIKGITNAFRRYTDKNQFCGIGSVKTNFGHLVAASGMASMIKVILSLKNKMIPPTINFEKPNPYINFNTCPVFVNDELRQWDKGEYPRRAGVSSFGFSGTNCHVVLEEAPDVIKRKSLKITKEKPKNILALSARSENVLKDLVNKYIEFIVKGKVTDLNDICYTANTGRGHFTCRLAFVLKDYEDFKEKLLQVSRTDFHSLDVQGVYYKEHKIVSENKKVRESWEITESQKRVISEEASTKINELSEHKADFNLYDEICKLYIEGANIEWDMLYKGQDVKRVSVPIYPLERIRCWAAPKDFTLEPQRIQETKELEHPLFDSLLAESIDRQIFVTHFNNKKHWVLDEHRFNGKSLLPGTTYLEMAREASKAYYGDSAVELRDIVFVSPLFVDDDQIKDVQTIVIKQRDHLQFAVVSKQSSDDFTNDGIWLTHAEGKIYSAGQKSFKDYSISDLKNKCNKGENSKIKLSTTHSTITFGTRWDNVEKVFIGEEAVLIELKIDDAIKNETLNFSIHPALMDNAANMIMNDVGNGGLYLPLSYHSMKIYSQMPDKFYSYIRKPEKSSDSTETLSFDISLMDTNGKVFAEINNYTIKKVHDTNLQDADKNADSYYEINWIPEKLTAPVKKQTKKTALIFKDDTGIADGLINRMKPSIYDQAIEVSFGKEYKKVSDTTYEISGTEEEYVKLMADLRAYDIKEILHLSTILDNDAVKNIPADGDSQKKGMYSLFYLTKALAANKYNKEINICLLSSNVDQVIKEDTIYPGNSTLFGLGKVIIQENQNLTCRFIDLDKDTPIDMIVNEIVSDTNGLTVAYRKGIRYIPEFSATNLKMIRDYLEIKNAGVYIITGGIGGIGLEIAKYIASKNKTNIALINRTKLPDEEKWDTIIEKNEDEKLCKQLKEIKNIKASGSTVICCSADITNEAETETAICSLREKFGRINGIVHAAGIAGDGFVVIKDSEVFKNVIAPKIEGTRILDKMTENDEMDFFVLFSSVTSLTGGIGQGDYTAANSFLNTFAELRNKNGKRTVAINWPGWKETGMAVDNNAQEERVSFKSITTANGLKIFEDALRSELPVIYTGKLNIPLLSGVGDKLPVKLSAQIKAVIDKYLHEKNKIKGDALSSKENTETVKESASNSTNSLESKLAVIWGSVLGIKEVDIYDNFHDMGGDSILATQLLKEIDKEYPEAISISDIFSYPTVSQLAEFISSKVELKDDNQVDSVEEQKKKTLN
jgi:polyketide synthase PksN